MLFFVSVFVHFLIKKEENQVAVNVKCGVTTRPRRLWDDVQYKLNAQQINARGLDETSQHKEK